MIRIRSVTKGYPRHSGPDLEILSGIDLDIEDGAFEALMGPSGSGKTTLLNIIAGLDRPSSGEVQVEGQELTTLSDASLSRWRARSVGFVFQSFNLIPVLTALENVQVPLLTTRLSTKERATRAHTALEVVGLSERADHLPRQLSGGQEQRVAIARALVTDPRLIVADEPTGDLDRKSADHIMTLLSTLNSEFGKTIVMVTHDPEAAERCKRTRRLDKGVLA
ncbi:MAG: ABC transporter ATP-binding protein [Myxococcota bacterium]